jgi:RNA polymerase-binding transcription factor DksA
MSKHEAARVRLKNELARLLERVGKIEGDLRQAHDRDWQEQAIELENDEVLEGLDEMTLGHVRRIRAALGRIANGTYGACSTCGRAISEERLDAIPSALTCLTCSTERRGNA